MALMVICGLMLLEGAGIYLIVSMMSDSPQEAAALAVHDAEPGKLPEKHEEQGEEHGEGHGEKKGSALTEIFIAECKPTNNVSGRLYYYSIKVTALVKAPEDEHKLEELKKFVENNKARLEERVNVVVRSADPRYLNEPGFEMLKRQLKEEFGRLLGDDLLIQDVLIPELIRMGGQN